MQYLFLQIIYLFIYVYRVHLSFDAIYIYNSRIHLYFFEIWNLTGDTQTFDAPQLLMRSRLEFTYALNIYICPYTQHLHLSSSKLIHCSQLIHSSQIIQILYQKYKNTRTTSISQFFCISVSGTLSPTFFQPINILFPTYYPITILRLNRHNILKRGSILYQPST